ncbi:MAG: hypothetical protein ACU0DW_13820 [Shimia sp.]
MRRILGTCALIACATSASAWDVLRETNDQGRELVIAEKIGEAGMLFSAVCDSGTTHIEVFIPGSNEPEGDAALLFQVDRRPELLIAGFFEPVDRSSDVFVGIDIRDKPATRTEDLLTQIRQGNALFLGDPDLQEAVERWDLSGSSAALRAVTANCK